MAKSVRDFLMLVAVHPKHLSKQIKTYIK